MTLTLIVKLGHALGAVGVGAGVGHGEDAWAGVGQLKILIREFVTINAAAACRTPPERLCKCPHTQPTRKSTFMADALIST